MTERNDDPYVTDPFLARIALPSMEEPDPDALRPRVWPITSPRVRKVLTEQLEDLVDQHFLTKVFAAILAGAVFMLGGITLLLALRLVLPFEPQYVVFGVAYTLLFIGLTFAADRFRPPTPREVYYASYVDGGETHRGDRATGRVLRALLFGPYLVSVAYRKILEPPPPANEPTLDVALRLLPMLHEPLPLYQAELAGIAGRDEIREAALLLHALHLADLVMGPGAEVLMTPRTACAQLLREENGEAAAGEEKLRDPDAPWMDMDPELVQTSEIDTMELVRQAEDLGLKSIDTTPREIPPAAGAADAGDEPGEEET